MKAINVFTAGMERKGHVHELRECFLLGEMEWPRKQIEIPTVSKSLKIVSDRSHPVQLHSDENHVASWWLEKMVVSRKRGHRGVGGRRCVNCFLRVPRFGTPLNPVIFFRQPNEKVAAVVVFERPETFISCNGSCLLWSDDVSDKVKENVSASAGNLHLFDKETFFGLRRDRHLHARQFRDEFFQDL